MKASGLIVALTAILVLLSQAALADNYKVISIKGNCQVQDGNRTEALTHNMKLNTTVSVKNLDSSESSIVLRKEGSSSFFQIFLSGGYDIKLEVLENKAVTSNSSSQFVRFVEGTLASSSAITANVTTDSRAVSYRAGVLSQQADSIAQVIARSLSPNKSLNFDTMLKDEFSYVVDIDVTEASSIYLANYSEADLNFYVFGVDTTSFGDLSLKPVFNCFVSMPQSSERNIPVRQMLDSKRIILIASNLAVSPNVLAETLDAYEGTSEVSPKREPLGFAIFQNNQ